MSTAKYEVKTISRAEEYYTFNQSNQIFVQAGFIGYLRADFGSDENEFYNLPLDSASDSQDNE